MIDIKTAKLDANVHEWSHGLVLRHSINITLNNKFITANKVHGQKAH